MLAVFHSTLALLYESAPFLLLGFALAGAAKVWLQREGWLARTLGRRGPRSVSLAALIGAPLPLCSCSVLPAALGLRRQGASKGATSSFLISVPETDVISVLLTWALLGPLMAVVRPVSALVTAIVTGMAVDLFDAEAPASGAEDPARGRSGEPAVHRESKPAWRRALHFGFVEFFDDISGPLLFGLLLAGVVAVVVPAVGLFRFVDEPVSGYAIALLVGVPTYVCATASTPVAVGLLAAGMSPGAALVFLLAGPATNVASLVVLGREFGRRTLVIYLVGIAALSLALGVGFDFVFGADALRLGATDLDPTGRAWWEIAAAIVLGGLMVASACRTGIVERPARRLLGRFRTSA